MSNSSSDVMVWVKEAGVDGAAFTVFVASDAIVDHLKDAIKKKEELTCGTSKLKIKETIEGDILGPGREISKLSGQNDDEHPIYFSQPTGKFRP